MTQTSSKSVQPTMTVQPSPDNQQDNPCKFRWSLCNLVALIVGSGINRNSFQEWIDQLNDQGLKALCIKARYQLYYHQKGLIPQPLPSIDMDGQVEKLQKEARTYKGAAFLEVSECDSRGEDQQLETVDILYWILKTGNFLVGYEYLDSELYEVHVVILSGYMLGRLGRVVKRGTLISPGLVQGIVEQYKSAESAGSLLDPEGPVRRLLNIPPPPNIPKPSNVPPPPKAVLPPLGTPLQYPQLDFNNPLMWTIINMLLLLLLIAKV